MKKCAVILSFLLITFGSFGQLEGITQTPTEPFPPATITRPNVQLKSSKEVQEYIQNTNPLFASDLYQLTPRRTKTSLTGNHYTFDISYASVPVFGVQIKVHTTQNGNVILIQDNSLTVDAPTSTSEFGLKGDYWIFINNQWHLAQLKISDVGSCKRQLVSNNEVLYEYSTKLNFQQPDTLVKAHVFLVNPLNTAERSYGSPYIDSSDLDVPELNAERKWVDMKVFFENDTFWLKSERYYFGDVSDPVNPQTFSTIPEFSFLRSQYQFEDVNAFYHITAISNYVEQLGFSSALPDSLVIDAHAYNGGDRSSFNYDIPDGSPNQLEFGEGGVDDAEDGEIVVHEYGHSLSYEAAEDSYAETRDRGAMEEGNADYISASYSKFYSDFAWEKMFNWDGHNPFFPGITIGAPLKYPSEMTNNTNADREMWSTPLMCLYDKIGRSACDSLFLEHLYYQYKSATIPDMANVLLVVDSLMFSKKYERDIRNCFAKHEILASTHQSIEFTKLFNAYNSTGFSQGNGNVTITTKTNQTFSYSVYDGVGQKISSGDNIYSAELNPNYVNSGVYIVELYVDGVSSYLKLIKH